MRLKTSGYFVEGTPAAKLQNVAKLHRDSARRVTELRLQLNNESAQCKALEIQCETLFRAMLCESLGPDLTPPAQSFHAGVHALEEVARLAVAVREAPNQGEELQVGRKLVEAIIGKETNNTMTCAEEVRKL